MVTMEQLRTMGYEVSQAIAPTWERRRPEIEAVVGPVREWMLRNLAPRAGETVLELAAGVGDTGFDAARSVGPDGDLICSDFAPAMVDAARRRGGALGLGNVDYRVIDAERIDLDSDSVDGVLCRYGYMLMTDPAAALAETRRVLRRGGRLALAVWGAPQRNPFFTIAAGALVQRGHIPPAGAEGPGIFSMADEKRTLKLLTEAGFGEIRIDELPARFAFGDMQSYLAFVADTAGPLAFALRRLPEPERREIEADVEDALAPFATAGGYELPGVTLAAVAS